jgi:glycosyltransferase involved in cell wall biosynthesis
MPEQLLRTCPLGIDPQVFGDPAEPLPLADDAGELVTSRRVRFLNMSEPVPRKNLRGLLRAWLVATDKADDAILVLKVGGLYAEEFTRIDQSRAELEVEQHKAFSDAAAILMLRNLLLPDDDMPRLYATATHYISMSHGEGWDLPMMEAAASGLLLIAPDHSAYQTYLNPSIATLLPSAEVPVDIPEPDASLFEGARWWNPSHDAAVAAIREAIDGRDRTVASPRDFILGHWTWEHATERLIEILSEVEHS